MNGDRELTRHYLPRRALWICVGIGAVGVVGACGLTLAPFLASASGAHRQGLLVAGLCVGVLSALVGLPALYAVTARVRADAYGVHTWTLLRRRSVPWQDVAELRIYRRHEKTHRIPETRRVALVLRGGRKQVLPLLQSRTREDPEFDAKLDALHALHTRYGAPESDRIPVISHRTAGQGWAGPLSLCVLLLAGAGLAAWAVPQATSHARAWQAATPCTEQGDSTRLQREPDPPTDCLTTLSTVIAKAEVNYPKKRSWLYFVDARPRERIGVPKEGAVGFEPGDRVELTIWRGQVMEVAGKHHTWHEHIIYGGDVVVAAAALVLLAGYPAARLLLRVRGRRLPDDEVLPSALPFAGVLVGTAVWLLPLCYRHSTGPPTSRAAITWVAVGSLVSLGLFVWAWRATRVRTPEAAGAPGVSGARGEAGAAGEAEKIPGAGEDVFLAASFLEATDYNPNRFGTHIVLGDGPPAVTPHSGPGRFAAKEIPVERLTVKGVRRVRGSDDDTVPRSWHIAELDDAGKPVRLAAAPADLTRILRELGLRSRREAHSPRTGPTPRTTPVPHTVGPDDTPTRS